jgi:hypothetical protein
MRLEGGLELAHHLPPALNLASDSMLDPERYHPSRRALTQSHVEHVSDFTLVLPWEAGLSLRFQSRDWRLNLDYLYYLRGLSLSYATLDSAAVYDDSARDLRRNAAGLDSVAHWTSQQSYRLRLQQHLAVGVEFRQVFLHLGALFYTVSRASLVEETAAFQPDFLPFLPTLNVGYHFPLGPRFTTTVSLVAFPVSLFKTTVEYRY